MSPVEEILANFVVKGNRLEALPSVRANVFWRLGRDAIMSLVGTNSEDPRQGRFHGSMIAAPIINPIDVASALGVVTLDSEIKNFFTQEDLSAVQVLAALILLSDKDNSRFKEFERVASDEIGRRLREVRKSLDLSVETVARRSGLPAEFIATAEGTRSQQNITRPQALEWCRALGLYAEPNVPLVQLVDPITPQLLTLLKEKPEYLARLTPEQFEHLTANRLDAMGYDVTLTGPTNRKDGGVDIIAVPRDLGAGTFLLACQVKHHQEGHKTGREAVDRLVALKNGDFRVGLLVTNTEFTQDAKFAAAMNDNKFFARLRDFEDLKRWIEDDFSNENEFRELPSEITLAPGVTVKIPRPRLKNLTAFIVKND